MSFDDDIDESVQRIAFQKGYEYGKQERDRYKKALEDIVAAYGYLKDQSDAMLAIAKKALEGEK